MVVHSAEIHVLIFRNRHLSSLLPILLDELVCKFGNLTGVFQSLHDFFCAWLLLFFLLDVGFGLTMNPNFFLITPFLATPLFNDQILCPDVALDVINWRLLLDVVRMAVGFVIRLDRCRMYHALFHFEHFIDAFVGFINTPRFYR